jgi:23S rRNA (guanine745-N1)-methyltransferase
MPSPAERRRALAAVVAYLRCPACAGPLHLGRSRLACGRGHSFDIACHGYANLTAGRHDPGLPGLVVDLAGGTGHYLAGVLDALPHRHGVCLDLSVPALRRAARAHPRAAALGADVWQPLPFADRSAALVVSIFGPRNAAETGRVLAPDGTLIIAAPGPRHLGELRPFTVTVDLQIRVFRGHGHAATKPVDNGIQGRPASGGDRWRISG